jgi:large subunit ribosomal protein L21
MRQRWNTQQLHVRKVKEVTMEQMQGMFKEYALFGIGSRQYQAIPGKTVAVEKLEGNVGDSVTLKEVVFKKDAAGKIEIGQPYVKGASISASILRQDLGPKLVVFRFKRRKKVRVKRGHRQPFTVIRIEKI